MRLIVLLIYVVSLWLISYKIDLVCDCELLEVFAMKIFKPKNIMMNMTRSTGTRNRMGFNTYDPERITKREANKALGRLLR